MKMFNVGVLFCTIKSEKIRDKINLHRHQSVKNKMLVSFFFIIWDKSAYGYWEKENTYLDKKEK